MELSRLPMKAKNLTLNYLIKIKTFLQTRMNQSQLSLIIGQSSRTFNTLQYKHQIIHQRILLMNL